MTDYELPAEAEALIQRVASLEAQASSYKQTFERDLVRIRAGIDAEAKRLAAEQRKQERELARLGGEIEADRQALEALIENRVRGFEFIARAWADYERARADTQAHALRSKSHPAFAAADAVRDVGRERAEGIKRAKLAEWIVELYEWHFPWLAELRDLTEEEAYLSEERTKRERTQDDDPVAAWLSDQEFRDLSVSERNQRALDRYLRSRKTPWQLGRDYERYVGYLREQTGHRVTYQGIFLGLEDLGRDVLAEKGTTSEIIQCKRWSQRKTIHEKHVFQLFGTVVLARLEHPDKTVSGTFTTTTSLSPKAREVAGYLDIRVEDRVPLADYPRVKCNISRLRDERIYHLPFDQQYDRTVIDPELGERYVSTVAEAEELGFRRAWRWKGTRGGPLGS
jgi:hypothetical protein